ncbi:MAG TPA: aminopeptidase [Stellaceae bacterium]|nr:aminopeptidase [Stellaceae bacterium]
MCIVTEARAAGTAWVGTPKRGARRACTVARSPATPLACMVVGLLSACGTPYLMQATGGELRILHERVPIARLLADPDTPQELRTRLLQVQAARDFASRELHLPDNRSYRSYADIGREFVVWNVVAAPEFSVEPKHWCFPVAGCVSYRGYFHERRAREFAASLAAGGFDTAVEGVPAFSTLGRFADPVLSSMLRYDDDDLAATIFHELAHQLLYVRDDSEFNEAFATTVEDVGLDRWLAHQGQSSRMQTFRAEQALDEKFVGVLGAARARLVKLYASGMPRDEMRDAKAAIFNSLTEDIRALETSAGLGPLYDQWIASGLNNARLAAVATYYDCVPGFMRLLKEQDGDLPRFYAAARELASQTREGRHARLCGQANTSAQ